jgi:hypothetical protein
MSQELKIVRSTKNIKNLVMSTKELRVKKAKNIKVKSIKELKE